MTDLSEKIRNDAIVHMAYKQGQLLGLDELEILKRLTLILLELKDEAFQKKLNEAMRSTKQIFYKPDI